MTLPLLPTDEDRAAALAAAARLLGLSVAPEWREEILFHMKVLGEAAQLLADFPLDDVVEPAAIFAP